MYTISNFNFEKSFTARLCMKDKERKRVNRFPQRELPQGERQQEILTESSASSVSEPSKIWRLAPLQCRMSIVRGGTA